MRAVFFTGDSTAEVAELPDPSPGRGQVRLRMHTSSICGTDLHRYRNSAEVREPYRRVVTGHEASGVVDQVGEGVDDDLVGARFAVFQGWGCTLEDGPCEEARAPGSKRCAHATIMGVNTNGSNAEFQIVPTTELLPLPDSISWEDSTLLVCSFGTAYAAVDKLAVPEGGRAIVWGLGPVGLCCAAILRSDGVDVVGIDVSEPRTAFAERLGIESRGEWVTERDGLVAAMVDTTGNGSLQTTMLDALAPEGSAVIVGLGTGTSLGDNVQLIFKELTVRGTMIFTREQWPAILEAYDRCIPRLSEVLITERVDPADSPGAFTRAAAASTSKILIDWAGSR